MKAQFLSACFACALYKKLNSSVSLKSVILDRERYKTSRKHKKNFTKKMKKDF